MGQGFFEGNENLAEEFEGIVKAYEKKVYNMALKNSHNAHDAYDIAQEVFISVAKNLKNFRGDSSLSTWIYRITANKCIDFGRKRQKQNKFQTEEDIFEGERNYSLRTSKIDENPEEHLLKTQMSKEINKTLEKLSQDHREMIILRDVNGFSYEEIARMKELSEGTVKSRISRARENMRELLKKEGNFFKEEQSIRREGGVLK